MLTIGVMAGERVAVGVVEENRVVSAIRRLSGGRDAGGDSRRRLCGPATDRDRGSAGGSGDRGDRRRHAGHHSRRADRRVAQSATAQGLEYARGAVLGVPVELDHDSERRRSGGGRNRGDARGVGEAGAGLDARNGARVWPLSAGRRAFGRRGIPSSRWTRRSDTAAAGGSGIWKAFWAIARCGCAFSTWSRRRFSWRRRKATSGAGTSRTCFIGRWRRRRRAASIWTGRGSSISTGPNSKFVETGLLHVFLHDMVKMSTLQGSYFEVIPTPDEIAIIGAAVNAITKKAAAFLRSRLRRYCCPAFRCRSRLPA